MTLKIGEVANIAKVSIRTLHHYDEIGLLSPSGRTDSGYRLYSQADMEKLQQILFYKMLEFPLDKIHQLMSDPSFDRKVALREQRQLLAEKSTQLNDLLTLIDNTINDLNEDITMELKELFEAFPEITPEMVAEEEAELGHTPQYRQSRERANSYSKGDWLKIRAEVNDINTQLETLFTESVSAQDERAISVINKARLHIDKWHFDCPKEFHVNLTEMTMNDERYRSNIDENCEGLAAWMHEAAKANFEKELLNKE